jgi:HK97 family phage portal protein
MQLSLLIRDGWSRLSRMFGVGGTSQQRGQQIPGPGRYDQPGAGIPVYEANALQVSALWGCVRILTETIGTLPFFLYEKGEDGEMILAENHPLYIVLKSRPNRFMTATEFLETMQANLVLKGNAYGVIDRNGRGDVIALYPMAADQVLVNVLPDGEVVYLYRTDGQVLALAAENVLHVKLFGNGVIGLSPLEYARNSLGLAIASDQYAANFFSKGGKPGGLLTYDKVLTDPQREAIKKNFSEMHEGIENAHKLFVLEAGMKYERVQITPQDAQIMDARRYSVADVSRFFGVPLFMLNETDKSTSWGTGLEQQMIGFFTITIRPYLRRWEDAVEAKCLRGAERAKYQARFLFEGLLRADSAGRAEFYSKMVTNGIMTRAEVRAKENLPKIRGNAEVLTVQSALVPLDKLGEKQPAPAAPGAMPGESDAADAADAADLEDPIAPAAGTSRGKGLRIVFSPVFNVATPAVKFEPTLQFTVPAPKKGTTEVVNVNGKWILREVREGAARSFEKTGPASWAIRNDQ